MMDESVQRPRLLWQVGSNRKRFGLLASLIFSLVCLATIDPQKMQQVMESRYGNDGVAILGAWNRMLNNAVTVSPEAQLTALNEFFNTNILYTDDNTLWKKSDYWA